MSKEMMQEFFVSLGFEVDKGELNKFKDGLAQVGKAAAVAGAAVAAMAVAVTSAVTSVANEFDELDDTARRLGTTSEKLKELQYIGEFTDASAQAVTSSLEALGKMAGLASLGVGAGAKKFEELGLSAKNADGSLRDSIDLLDDVKTIMDGMGQGEKLAIMQTLGIDASMIDVLSNDASALTAEFRQLTEATGIDWNSSGLEAGVYADNLKKLQMTLGFVWRGIATGFFSKFSDSFERLQKTMVELAPKIIQALTPVVGFFSTVAGLFFTLTSATVRSISFLMKAFDGLGDTTKTIIKISVAVGVAWLALNAIFTASPIGRLIALLGLLAGAVALLIDDFETFNEGGDSFFDWSGNVIPNIKLITTLLAGTLGAFLALKATTAILAGITAGLALVKTAIIGVNTAMFLNPIGAVVAGIVAGVAIGYGLYKKFGVDFLDLFMVTIPRGLEVVAGAFKSLLSGAVELMRRGIRAVGDAWDYVTAHALAFGRVVLGVIATVISSIIEFVVALKNASPWEFITSRALAFGSVASGVFKRLLRSAVDVFAGIRQWFGGMWDYLTARTEAGKDVISNVFKNLGRDIIDSMAGVLSFFTDMWTNITNGANTALSQISKLLPGGSVNVTAMSGAYQPSPYAMGSSANTQNNNITVNGVTDPNRAASAVSNAIPALNTNNRNFGGVQ